MQLSSISSSVKSKPPELRRIPVHELERLAESCLQWFEHLTWLDPFETGQLATDLFLERVCEQSGYSIEFDESPPWRKKGHLIYAKTEPLIKRVSVALCGDIDERSRRYAMAHEAFHVFHDHDFILQHHNIPGAVEAAMSVMDYNANDFARIIHLPAGLLEKQVRKTLSQGRSIPGAVDSYSTMFGISTKSVKIRLKELNLATGEELGLD